MGLCMITFTGGEPLLFKGSLALLAYAFQKGYRATEQSTAANR
jgi:organic radical activating enzyme